MNTIHSVYDNHTVAKLQKNHYLFIAWYVYIYSQTLTFLCYYRAKKLKQEPLEKAKLFTRFSEMELLGRFCVVFSVLSL